MSTRPLVLVHGYSDTAKGFKEWRDIIENQWKKPTETVFIGNYVSLTNEVTIKDIAEGFDRALRREAGLKSQEFDAIVHSTGMLVLRAWLNSYSEGAERRERLKHLIALAPATNGSPIAHRGRSWLGSIFKGNRQRGPDFMEAGDEVLYGLELGSRFTWDLAHEDLIGDNARFRAGPDSPFVFTFCGNRNYGFVKSLVTEEQGTDGTVRWAGCTLNSRKITVDLMVSPDSTREPTINISDWLNQEHPLVFVDGVNHGTIMSSPPKQLQELVKSALEVESAEAFTQWNQNALAETAKAQKKARRWQQFVIRVVDERGDPVTDWNVQLSGRHNSRQSLEQFGLDVHVYKRDPSLRCFHVDLDRLQPEMLSQLHLRLMASSGTQLVSYHGAGSERISSGGAAMNPDGKWDAKINLTGALGKDNGFSLFYPFTTTLIEICLNREPMPMVGRNKVYWFGEE
jgi:hypothetical protein